ncbi:MAG: TonB-dependent receptor [Opitutaceae bacterium]
MSFFHFVSVSLLSAALLLNAIARAQAAVPPTVPPPPPVATPDPDHALSLDQVVVSSGFQDKTAFDLAQGSSILAGDQLRRQVQTTLGETLAATPGINSTYYGPGASRPIIRGLGGDRIRVLDSGVGALDAANISPDHNTALEPLFAERIEVLRGPATLLYGSSAVGGVVNVIDNRIPATPLDRSFGGAIEARGFGAAREKTAVGTFTAGTKELRVQLNGLTSRSEDVRIPEVARIDADAPPDQPRGTLPNSEIKTESGSIGAAWFGADYRVGAAISTYATTYGVPVDEPISIDMHQRRLDLDGETTKPMGFFQGVKARLGFGDYTHSEIADRITTNTTFKNTAWEGRVELPHAFTPQTSGTFGAQASRSDFSAVGEEVVTPPSVTSSRALFALEEWKQGPITFQGGARLEWQSVKLGDFDAAALPSLPGYGATPDRKKTARGASGSLGAVFYPKKDWALGLSVAYTERLPTAQELFSNGPHGGTGAYEVGTSGLPNERSLGIDLSIRRRAGFVTGTASVFTNTFRNFIFEQELAAGSVPTANNLDGLTPYQFVAKDAEFYGAEAEVSFHLIETPTQQVHLALMSDYVHAQQTTDDVPLPRIPPLRFGAGLRFEHAGWGFGVEARHTARQNRFTAMETSTPGFTLLNADVSYTLTREHGSYEFFARGTNLTDKEARVHSSFLKDFAALAGRGVLAGARIRF